MPDQFNVVCGLPDGGQAWITQFQPTVEIRWDGSLCFLPQIGLEQPWVSVWVGPAAPAEVTFQPGPVINYIADADLCGTALQAASAIARQVPRPWFNHPDRIRTTTRDRISAALQGISDVSVPKVVRCRPAHIEDIRSAIAAAGIGYPALARAVGTHRGRTLLRIEGPDDTEALMSCLAHGAELYLCPFVDFADADGLYRKHRVVMVGGRPILNSLVTTDHWKVHAAGRIWNEATIATERAALDGFASGLGARFAPQWAEIHRRLGLDYFGIDFALRPDGSILIFEANAVMDVLGPASLQPDIWVASGQAIETALRALLNRPDRWVEPGVSAQ